MFNAAMILVGLALAGCAAWGAPKLYSRSKRPAASEFEAAQVYSDRRYLVLWLGLGGLGAFVVLMTVLQMAML